MNPFTEKLLNDLEELSDQLDAVMLTLTNQHSPTVDRKEMWITLDQVQHALGRTRMHIEGMAENERVLLESMASDRLLTDDASLVYVRGHVSAHSTTANANPVKFVIKSVDG